LWRLLALLSSCASSSFNIFFFFNDPATTVLYTLSLHDALPILEVDSAPGRGTVFRVQLPLPPAEVAALTARVASRGAHQLDLLLDRKSTRLNSSHVKISYAVFCLKKKKKKKDIMSEDA